MQRYNRERMRDDGIKFIHIISIEIAVYNNSINMKILIHPWIVQQQTFKFPQASCIVLLDDIRIHRRRKLFTIQVCEYQCSIQESLLHHKRSFIVQAPFPLKIFLNMWHLLQNKVSLIEFTWGHPFVKNVLHSSLIQLPMTHRIQFLSFNKIQLVKMRLDPLCFLQCCFWQNIQRRNLYFDREDNFHLEILILGTDVVPDVTTSRFRTCGLDASVWTD